MSGVHMSTDRRRVSATTKASARRSAGLWPRAHQRPSLPEWLLFAYLIAACVVTVYARLQGAATLRELASSPDDIALGRLGSLITSLFVIQGPLVAQVVATAVLGVAAMRLAGGRLFWLAALLASFFGTLLVYAAVWVAAAIDLASVVSLEREPDFGVSLTWCAALGVLAVAGVHRPRPQEAWLRYLLMVVPTTSIVAVAIISDGLARYEHVVAFALAAAVTYLGRRWARAR